MVRLFLDSGIRRGELAGLKAEDVDLDQEAAAVLGKGRRPRPVPLATRPVRALDCYLRARARRPDTPASRGCGSARGAG
jgi:site-specific recombinase XerC